MNDKVKILYDDLSAWTDAREMRDQIIEDIVTSAHTCGPNNGELRLRLFLLEGDVEVTVDIEKLLLEDCTTYSDNGEPKPEWSKKLFADHLRALADKVEQQPNA